MIRHKGQQGYALITALIVTAVVTALVLGFIQQVNTEQKIARNDTDYSSAFYAAEAGLEKLNSDLSKLFQQTIFPSADQLADLTETAARPALTGVTYATYEVIGGQNTLLNGAIDADDTTATVDSTTGWPTTGYFMIDSEEITYTGLTSTTFTGLSRAANGSIAATHTDNARVTRSRVIGSINEGPNAGLSAQVIPFTLNVVSQAGVGTEASLSREVQVALIPVFQFGIFSDSDLSFFAGPVFNFGGRVHSNGDIYLAAGNGGTTLSQKVTSASEIIRDVLANTALSTENHNGNVAVVQTAGVYRNLVVGEGSVEEGPTSSANAYWTTLSLTTYNGNLLSAATGGKPLVLPFAGGGASPIEIIRRPGDGENSTTILGQSRLYNQASLRILLSDAEDNLPSDDGYILDNTLVGYTPQAGPPFRPPFATANAADPDYLNADNSDETTNDALIGGYIRIDRQNANGSWTDVTMEILNLGISTNQADAILRFQQPSLASNPGASLTSTDYWPINIYDTRESHWRDTSWPTQLRKVGIMNLVELDANNLRRWFAGTIGTTGTLALSNNGYIVYFSDRRGNRDAGGNETAEFGFEDVVNPLDDEGDPDLGMSTGEDLNENTTLERYGANLPYNPWTASTDLYTTTWAAANGVTDLNEDLSTTETGVDVGDASGITCHATDLYYYRIESEWVRCTAKAGNTLTVVRGQLGSANVVHDGDDASVMVWNQQSGFRGMKNRVHYFRRALRLVNGANTALANNLPSPGFTVASENPLYVLGNYNAYAGANGFTGPHSFSAVIADAVTLLSSTWSHLASFRYPYTLNQRNRVETNYRMAIAAGKGINFPRPANVTTTPDFGTDGGTHNFLRYLEQGGANIYYRGSIVSLYYYRQATGTYKCCNAVYGAPGRQYAFDTDFLVPSQLPPGTPRFRDINNLSFRQTLRAD